MSKRLLQIAVAFLAVAMFVLAPIACQQAEPPAETTEEAKPAGQPDGKKLMAAQPKAAADAAETAGEVVEEGAEAVEEGTEAVEEVVEEGEKAAEEVTEGH